MNVTITLTLTPAGTFIMEFLQTLTWPQIGIAAAAITVLYFINKDSISNLLSRFIPTKEHAEKIIDNSIVDDVDDDIIDMQALKRLQDRARHIDSKEFTQALNICSQHFFEKCPVLPPTPPPAPPPVPSRTIQSLRPGHPPEEVET